MSRSTATLPNLSQDLWQVLLLIVRYRALTLELLQLLCPDVARDALRMRLDALQKQSWLVSLGLTSGERCYALAPRAQRLFGVHQTRGFPFTGDGLLQHLGIASLCGMAQYSRLLSDEFRARYPAAYRPGLPLQNFCLDQQDTGRLCWAVVDHASEPRRFRSKIGRIIARWLGTPALEQLMRSGQLRIGVITAVPEKQKRIEQALAADAPWTAAVDVVAIPSLLQFYLQPPRIVRPR